MTVRAIDVRKAKEKALDYTYGLVYLMSELRFDLMNRMEPVPWEECYEARFFNEEEELHLYGGPDHFKAVIYQAGESDGNQFSAKYILQKKYAGLGNRLLVRENVGYDDDGQIMITRTALAGVIREEEE